MLTLPSSQRLRWLAPALCSYASSSSACFTSAPASAGLRLQHLLLHRRPIGHMLTAAHRAAPPRRDAEPLLAAAAVIILTAAATLASAVCEGEAEGETEREQERRLAALVSAVIQSLRAPDPSLSPAEWSYLQAFACQSPCTAYRYLLASGLQVDRAVQAVKATVRWRLAEGVDELTAAALRDKVEERSFWLSTGRDTRGGPVIIARKSEQPETDHRRQFQLIVYTLERAVRQMDDEARQRLQPSSSSSLPSTASSASLSSACSSKWTFFLQMSQYSRSSFTPLSEAQRVVDTLRLHYVERLRTAVILDAPAYFVFVYRCVSLLLPARLKQKVVFLRDISRPETQQLLQQHIALDQLEQPWGRLQPRNMADYIAEEEERLRHRQSRPQREI